jgi:GAF domain-containing protein/HAMP domain-containing protein
MQMTQFSSPPAENAKLQASAFRIGTIFLGSTALTIPVMLFLAWQTGAWQLYTMTGVLVVLGVLHITFVQLIRRGRYETGAWWFIATVLGALLIGVFLIADLGITVAITAVVLTFVIANQSLPAKWVRQALMVGVGAGLLAIVPDWLNLEYRLSVPALNIYVPAITVGIVMLAGIIVARQAWGGSLRNRLLTGTTTLTVVSIAILAFTNYYNDQINLTESSGAALKSAADTQAAAVGNVLLQETHVLQSFGLSKLVQDRVDEVNASYGSDQANNLDQIQALDTQWRAADKADNNNDPLVKGVLDSEVASELREFSETFPENVEVFVTDKYGANIAATNRTSDYYQADEDWWKAAYNGGKGAVYFGQPEFDQSSKTFGIILAVPLYSHGTQGVSGVMRTTINIESILAILDAKVLNGTGHTNLYLPEGQVLDPENENGVRPTDPKALELIPQLLSTKSFDTFTLDGIPSVVSAAWVTSTDPDVQEGINDLGWQIVVDQSQTDNLAPIRQQTQSTIVIALIILAISAAAGIFLAQTLTNPIARLTAVASEIAGGNLAAQARVESNDEIGTLASTFNSMTSQLQETLTGLEQRVADRTRNLELAAEVGRSVSQVGTLDVILKNAAEIIRSRFDLYYVQIYLTDPAQVNLLLLSGTGTVGAELLRRSHRLPLNAGSINGRAATEKKSVVIADTTTSATFRPNPLLPNTRSEMAVPLIVGGKVVGVLDLQSEKANTLTQELLPAFEALAGQLAIAIQNANLLAETNQARAELEAQARRLSRANWADYMDAIHKPEQTGYVFEENMVTPLSQAPEAQSQEKGNSVAAQIEVTGEAIGNLVVEMGGNSSTARSDELINTVARQVAQHIEALRLLESAERYRAEAEEASRRLTREGWQAYIENTKENLGYFYDLNEVKPHDGNTDAESALALPLKVRDEVLGKLAVQGLDVKDSQTVEFVTAVAGRLSAHIESLRQFEETKRGQVELDKRAQQLAAVADISTVSSKELDIQKLLESVVSLTQRKFGLYHAHIFIYDEPTDELRITACGWQAGDEHEGTHESVAIPLGKEQSLVARAARTRQAVIVNDVKGEPGFLSNPLLPHTASEMAVPLVIGDQVLGVLDVQSEQIDAFTAEDANIQTTLASQVATALQNARSFARAQQQAARESTLNVISQKIQSATSVEAVLQIAARELGHALGAPMTVAQLSMKDKS